MTKPTNLLRTRVWAAIIALRAAVRERDHANLRVALGIAREARNYLLRGDNAQAQTYLRTAALWASGAQLVLEV